LRMPVDLLWNGGIGTYVKASTEVHTAAGDRSNDAVRVNGRELRCKVVGEGGNLGFTQRGRVEFAMQGGRINTDFVDNSGGVDCSDHEVNIKILLSQAANLTNGARQKLLTEMTEGVAQLVLRDNYLQSQAISLAETQSAPRLQEHAYFIRSLELTQELDRDLEGLPSLEEIADRQKQARGFMRPELAVLISYSKMALYKRLIATDVAEDPYLGQELALYFPPALRKKYASLLPQHRLKREIIITAITNSLVNRMGPSFALRVAQDTGADAGVIARAYTIARESLEVRALWQQIEALDNRVPAAVQYQMVNETTRLLRFFTYWLIQQQHGALDIEAQVSVLRPGLSRLRGELATTLSDDAQLQYTELRGQLLQSKVPESLAKQIALLPALTTGPDIVRVMQQTRCDEKTLASLYQQLDQKLSFTWLRKHINELKIADRWQATARVSLRDQSYELQRLLCLLVLQDSKTKQAKTAEEKLARWSKANQLILANAQQSLKELRALSSVDFATLSVALQAIRRLAV
jgi:glutamate dehydrogenase